MLYSWICVVVLVVVCWLVCIMLLNVLWVVDVDSGFVLGL